MGRTGERFGPYVLVRQIAMGGMAAIYLARSVGESGFEKYMALKMIHPHLSADSHFVQMLIEEAKITVFLNHSNIGHVFDLGRIDDTYYIAMEYVDGADLYHIMRNITERDVQMSPEISAYIMHEVCAGLDYAHRCRDQVGNPLRIIHRDISPQNILVSRAGEIKVVDFGIAKAALRAKQTEVGVIKGKYYYMSPEQAWGRPLDQRTDIFSAGVVLYETLAGQMLYLEEDVAKLLEMVRRADIPPLHLRRPDVPRELEAITMKAVARRPEDRWQTAHDFQMALQGFLYRFAPTFTPQRVQDLVAFALNDTIDEETTSERTNRGATGRTMNSQISRQEFSSLFAHSIVFSDETSAGRIDSPFLMDAEEDFADATVVSAPPSFDGAQGEFGNDPSIPILVASVKDVVAPEPDQIWDDEDEPTTLMVRDSDQGGVTDRDVMSSVDVEAQWEATTSAQVPSRKGLGSHPSPPPLDNSGRPVGMVSVPEDGPGVRRGGRQAPMPGAGGSQGWGQASPMPAGG
ncbi:MAG: serine/threonine protein kinase, partial [Deltaproteobacteria bacterium]|nr:serine/threonine protein kinase [Deltaproteobacteria bacterium]